MGRKHLRCDCSETDRSIEHATPAVDFDRRIIRTFQSNHLLLRRSNDLHIMATTTMVGVQLTTLNV